MPNSTAQSSPYDRPIHLGTYYAGMTGLAIPITFARTGGGYLNCTDPSSGANAVCTGFIRRWDPRRQEPVGSIISQAVLTEVDPPHGKYLYDWLISDLGSVPVDPGIYVLTVDLLLPSGQETFSQEATFRVRSAMPTPY